jgi:hypothetical protein
MWISLLHGDDVVRELPFHLKEMNNEHVLTRDIVGSVSA